MFLIDENNVVIETGQINVNSDGFEKDGVIYGSHLNLTLLEAEAATDIVPMKYCYTEEKGFYLNPDYRKSINSEEEIKNLQTQIIGLQQALAEVTLMMMGGGNDGI